MLTYLRVFIGVRNLIGLDAHEKKEQKREEWEGILRVGRHIDCEDKDCGMFNWNVLSQRDWQRWQLAPWYFKKIDSFAYGGRIFLSKSNSVMHFWFLFVDVMLLIETMIDANNYLNARCVCLLCPSQEPQSSLRDFAMSWSTTSASVRHDLSSGFRGYNSMWDLNCNRPSQWKTVSSNQSVFITIFIIILTALFLYKVAITTWSFFRTLEESGGIQAFILWKISCKNFIVLFFKIILHTSL